MLIPARNRAGSWQERDFSLILDFVPVDQALVDHLVRTTGLSPAEAARVVEDVVSFHAEPVEAYVRRRHGELQLYGTRNAEIFTRIRAELEVRVVAPPSLSERQLRRIVYG